VYDPNLAKQKDILLTPSKARGLLADNTSPHTREFVREMLMFPLSVKNPLVPMAGGRRARLKTSILPKKDKDRVNYGPER
jgi:hypothetical protein